MLLTFAYNTTEARIYITIGSLDRPEAAAILRRGGTESKLSWLRLCEETPGERSAEKPPAQEFPANMRSFPS